MTLHDLARPCMTLHDLACRSTRTSFVTPSCPPRRCARSRTRCRGAPPHVASDPTRSSNALTVTSATTRRGCRVRAGTRDLTNARAQPACMRSLRRARPASIHVLTTARAPSQHTCTHYGARSSPHRYADFTNVQCNPFSNKIVLMDEVRAPGTARPACMCSPRRLGLPTGAQSGAPVRRHSA